MSAMKIVHICAGLGENNGMANTARQFVAEERARGDESHLTDDPAEIAKGVDVVHIHGAWLPVLWKAAKRAKRIGAKLIVRPAGSYDPVRLAYHGWKKRLVAPFERAMLRCADIVQATCAAEAEWIRAYAEKRGLEDWRFGGSRRLRIEITDLKRFFKLDLDEHSSSIWTGTGRPLHLLYLGRRHPLKGVEFLERAVAEIVEVGSRSRTVELRMVSDHFGEELERDWAWCDVLVLPTLSENFGRVVAEALERGKRVITTDGAPAWAPPEEVQSKSEVVVEQWRERLVYLKGYRDGTDAERVELLKRAVERFLVEYPA